MSRITVQGLSIIEIKIVQLFTVLNEDAMIIRKYLCSIPVPML